MPKIIIECEELPLLKDSKYFFNEVHKAYSLDCESATFDYDGIQEVNVKIEFDP